MSSVYSYQGKKVEFRGSVYNVIDIRRGRKYINADVSDDNGSIFKLRLGNLDSLKIVGDVETKATMDFYSKKAKYNKAKLDQEQELMKEWQDMEPKSGDTAVVRTGKYSNMNYKIGMVLQDGFYPEVPKHIHSIIIMKQDGTLLE